jgi:hypothetical protein
MRYNSGMMEGGGFLPDQRLGQQSNHQQQYPDLDLN